MGSKLKTPRCWKQIFLITAVATTLLGLFGKPVFWDLAIGPLHSPQGLGYPFADMEARLSMAEGLAKGIDINNEVNPYTRFTGLNNKPLYTVQALATLGLDRSDYRLMGVLFGLAFTAWNLCLLRPARWLDVILILAVLLSPPVLLLIERANDDIIIYSFILFVPLLLGMKGMIGRIAGWALIGLLTPMKYYPAAAYSLLFYRFRTPQSLLAFAAAFAVFLAGLFVLIQEEMATIRERIPEPPISFAVGGKLLFQTLQFDPALHSSLAHTLFAVIVLAALLVMLRTQACDHPGNPASARYFLLGSSILVFCFLLNSNWDYRLAFVLPTLPYVLWQLRRGTALPRCCAAVYLAGTLLTAWPEYIFFQHLYSPETRSWVLDLDYYRQVVLLKHSASWIMIAMNVALSALILRNDVFRLFEVTPGGAALAARFRPSPSGNDARPTNDA